MSELTELLAKLINKLAGLGLISIDELAKLVFTEELIIYEPEGRINYDELASLVVKGPVMIPCKRRRAIYAKKKLEGILGRKVEKKYIKLGGRRGYIFFIPEE